MIEDISMMTETLETDDELELEQETEKPESVEDSARAVIEELSGETIEADGAEHGAEAKEGKESTVDASEAARILARSKKPKKRQVIDGAQLQATTNQANEKPLEPPQRFPVQAKEQFHKLPRVVQEQSLAFWNGLEGNMTKKLQEAARYEQKYHQIDQVIQHYAPLWHESGFTDTQFLTEMCASYKNLKERPVETVKKIVANLGITPQQLFEGEQTTQRQQHNTQSTLTAQDVQRILEEREQQSQAESSKRAAASEIAALRNERDPNTGNYIYPELWDDSFLQRKWVQSLVNDYRETHPGISWAEATKRAVLVNRASMANAGSPSPTGTRLTPQDEINKIRQASVSVRPRGNGVIPTMSQAKRGESVRESAEAILAEFKRH